VIARVCVALVALAVLAWLGVVERGTRLQADGVELLQPGASAGELARAEAKFDAATLLNPDTAPEIDRALVYRARGEVRRAVGLVEDVVRREPDNLRAWAVMALLAQGNDAGAVRRAFAARQGLDPLNARRVPRPSR
jgi:predicted Zn-dependent protease